MHKRILSNINRRGSQENGDKSLANGDSPEAIAARGVRLFCESGGPNNAGEEVLHLPTIVEAAESSPAAAAEAARIIRKFLSKDNNQRAYVQYNAVMLIRILADNPGATFTKNIDHKFVETVKELLRGYPDQSVQSILRETLDSFQVTKAQDTTLMELNAMWKKEREKIAKRSPAPAMAYAAPPGFIPPPPPQPANYYPRQQRPRNTLPSYDELSGRLEEARTSATLLQSFIDTSNPADLLSSSLVKEFRQRCRSALNSVQDYIMADSPLPEPELLKNMVQVHNQLALAMINYYNGYSRAVETIMGRSAYTSTNTAPTPSPNPGSPETRQTPFGPHEAPSDFASPPAGPPPRRPLPSKATSNDAQNPFGDSHESAPGLADLQAPLQPQPFGLPPPGLGSGYQAPGNELGTNPSNGYAREVESPSQEQQQPAKPRYRF